MYDVWQCALYPLCAVQISQARAKSVTSNFVATTNLGTNFWKTLITFTTHLKQPYNFGRKFKSKLLVTDCDFFRVFRGESFAMVVVGKMQQAILMLCLSYIGTVHGVPMTEEAGTVLSEHV